MSSLTQYALTAPVETDFTLPASILNHADLISAFPLLAQTLKGLDREDEDYESVGLAIELANAYDFVATTLTEGQSEVERQDALELYFSDEGQWADCISIVDSDLQLDQPGKVGTCQPLVDLLQRRKSGEPIAKDLVTGLILGRLVVLEIAQTVEGRGATINDPHGDDVIDAPNGSDALFDEIDGALGDEEPDSTNEMPDFASISGSDNLLQVQVSDFTPLKTTMEAVKAIEGTHSVKIWLNGDGNLVLSGKLSCQTIDPAQLTMITAAFGHLNESSKPEFRPSGNNEIIFQAPIA